MGSHPADCDPGELEAAIAAYRPREELLRELALNLETRARQLLTAVPRIDRIAFRHKTPKSYAAKSLALLEGTSERKYKYPLVEIEDQVAGRVLVLFRKDIAPVVKALQPVFNTVEHATKKPNDETSFAYESDHLVCTIPIDMYPTGWTALTDRPETFELQVRTIAMHAWAEPQHDMLYKPGIEVTYEERRRLAWAASSAWGIDEILESVHNALEERRVATKLPI